MKYKITKTLSRTMEIDADSKDDAIKITEENPQLFLFVGNISFEVEGDTWKYE